MLAVTGEPGIGKTSLVEDFLAELAARPDRPIIARGRCSERLAGVRSLPAAARGARQPAAPWRAASRSHRAHEGVGAHVVLAGGDESPEESAVEQLRAEAQAASQERIKRELALFCRSSRARTGRALPRRPALGGRVDGGPAELPRPAASTTCACCVLATYRPSDMALAQHPFLESAATCSRAGCSRSLPLEFL